MNRNFLKKKYTWLKVYYVKKKSPTSVISKVMQVKISSHPIDTGTHPKEQKQCCIDAGRKGLSFPLMYECWLVDSFGKQCG